MDTDIGSSGGASPFAGTSRVASLVQRDGLITLVEGQTFCLSGRTGDLVDGFPHGLFVLDTRVLSRWELRVDGHRLEPLTADITDPFSATFLGRAHPRPGHADSSLIVFRHRSIGSGMRESISVVNFGLDPAEVVVRLDCHADFADLFEVKEDRVQPRPGQRREVLTTGVRFHEPHGAGWRSVEVRADAAVDVVGDALVWRWTLHPQQAQDLNLEVLVALSGVVLEPRFRNEASSDASLPARRLATWRTNLPVVQTDDAALMSAVHRTGEDLGALQIFDPDHPDVPILAAGAPWFMTVFGRDSLITGWMTLLAGPTLALGVLETLARFQGRVVDADTEEEPGKVLHEMRFHTAEELSLRSGRAYYGSVDASPLFVMLLGELQRWGAPADQIAGLLPAADRALAWIEAFGDRDGDGYVEYERRTDSGLANQGWKDSWDAIRHADGALASAPIALCEVQGYVYAAYRARVELAEAVGDVVTAERFAEKAATLRARFNEDFWVADARSFALGLDADKRQIAVLASNMGHCLWTGIVDDDRAASVAAHLVSHDLFSGWGIRTLGASMRAYNPVSYHNGSVWPHDNAICAAGLSRYGFVREAQLVIGAQLDAATHTHGRLPELFAGLERGNPPSPAAYPTSCSPQAWASASPLLWLRTLLGIDPDAQHGLVHLHPALPSNISRLRVDGIVVGDQRLSVSVDGGVVSVGGAGSLAIVDESG